MGAWTQGRRPITIAILAMGGEGGGVLSGWIADVAQRGGYLAQTTQVAGVAQRTGATVYYVELYPASDEPGEGSARPEPVLSMFPIPGECDIVVASELMEAGRAVQRGFVTPDRTTLICSTNRVYSILEKSHLADGRVDADLLLEGARTGAKTLVAADFMALALEAGSVISASLLGALAGSGALPFERDAYERAIEDAGKGVKQSLAAFDSGYAAAQDALAHPDAPLHESIADPEPDQEFGPPLIAGRPVPLKLQRRHNGQVIDPAEEAKRQQAASDPGSLIGPALQAQGRRILRDFPAGARLMLVRGCLRTALYQDEKYADRYLDRVARVVPFETDADGAASLTSEAARHMALLMTYQDTIHVAAQKVRRPRLDAIRAEVKAGPDDLVDIHEYLHPEVEEVTDTMPAAAGALLRGNPVFGAVVRGVGGRGITVNTTSVAGYTTLAALARLRPMRPSTLRFKKVQRDVDDWLDQVVRIAGQDAALALELVKAAGVVKGYGDTHVRGSRSFARLRRAADQLLGAEDAAATLAKLRQAALSDEGGKKLDTAFLSAGLAGVEDPTDAVGVDGAPRRPDDGGVPAGAPS